MDQESIEDFLKSGYTTPSGAIDLEKIPYYVSLPSKDSKIISIYRTKIVKIESSPRLKIVHHDNNLDNPQIIETDLNAIFQMDLLLKTPADLGSLDCVFASGHGQLCIIGFCEQHGRSTCQKIEIAKLLGPNESAVFVYGIRVTRLYDDRITFFAKTLTSIYEIKFDLEVSDDSQGEVLYSRSSTGVIITKTRLLPEHLDFAYVSSYVSREFVIFKMLNCWVPDFLFDPVIRYPGIEQSVRKFSVLCMQTPLRTVPPEECNCGHERDGFNISILAKQMNIWRFDVNGNFIVDKVSFRISSKNSIVLDKNLIKIDDREYDLQKIIEGTLVTDLCANIICFLAQYFSGKLTLLPNESNDLESNIRNSIGFHANLGSLKCTPFVVDFLQSPEFKFMTFFELSLSDIGSGFELNVPYGAKKLVLENPAEILHVNGHSGFNLLTIRGWNENKRIKLRDVKNLCLSSDSGRLTFHVGKEMSCVTNVSVEGGVFLRGIWGNEILERVVLTSDVCIYLPYNLKVKYLKIPCPGNIEPATYLPRDYSGGSTHFENIEICTCLHEQLIRICEPETLQSSAITISQNCKRKVIAAKNQYADFMNTLDLSAIAEGQKKNIMRIVGHMDTLDQIRILTANSQELKSMLFSVCEQTEFGEIARATIDDFSTNCHDASLVGINRIYCQFKVSQMRDQEDEFDALCNGALTEMSWRIINAAINRGIYVRLIDPKRRIELQETQFSDEEFKQLSFAERLLAAKEGQKISGSEFDAFGGRYAPFIDVIGIFNPPPEYRGEEAIEVALFQINQIKKRGLKIFTVSDSMMYSLIGNLPFDIEKVVQLVMNNFPHELIELDQFLFYVARTMPAHFANIELIKSFYQWKLSELENSEDGASFANYDQISKAQREKINAYLFCIVGEKLGVTMPQTSIMEEIYAVRDKIVGYGRKRQILKIKSL